jgi:signal peptidase I
MFYYLRWLMSHRVRTAAELRHHAQKLVNHQKDLLSQEDVRSVQSAIDNLYNTLRNACNKINLNKAIKELEEIGSSKLIQYKSPKMRENIEVGLFAVAIAMSIRTFFFQPMGIPTGSMQPTLYGITEGELSAQEQPITGVKGFFRGWLNGVSHYQLVAEGDWRLKEIESVRPFLKMLKRQKFKFIDLNTGEEIIRDIIPPTDSRNKSLFANYKQGMNTNFAQHQFIKNSHNGYVYKKGEDVFKMKRESGDHLLVNRFIYNFRKPKRGEIIVFETKNIQSLQQDLFYIKRLIGLPNESISIGNDRHVVVNGKRLDSTDHPFEFLYSFELDDNKKYARDSEFSGHVNRQGYADSKRNDGHVIPYRFRLFGDESFKLQIPQNEYLAFGDNTMNSTDSRDWGTLPGKNIFGTPSFIYWPFFSQPGRNRPHRFGWAFQ